jgi:gluconolactonase
MQTPLVDFRIVARGLRFPEGPIALPDGSFLVVEIARGRLTRVLPDGTNVVVADLGGGPNGAAIGPDGACYVCNNGGLDWTEDENGLRPLGQAPNYSGGRIERVDLSTGKAEVLYSASPSGPLRGPNDIVFDRHGGFWFTDSGKFRPRENDRSGIYYALPDGSRIVEVVYPMIQANGIGLSADETRLMTGRLWAFEVTGPGTIARHPWPSPNGGVLVAGVPGYQLFDSLALDEKGVCIATLMHGGINAIAYDGSIVTHHALPDRYTTNICFGGPDLRTAYVTLSQRGVIAAIDWNCAGVPLHFLDRAPAI